MKTKAVKEKFFSPHLPAQKWIIYFLIFLLAEYLTGFVLTPLDPWINSNSILKNMTFIFYFPLLVAYYFLPFGGLFFFPVLTFLDLYALFRSRPGERKKLLFYLSILGVYDAYLVWWWFFTDRRWDSV